MQLRIEPVTESGVVTGWFAALDKDDGSPAFDGDGATIERALAALVLQIGTYFDRKWEQGEG